MLLLIFLCYVVTLFHILFAMSNKQKLPKPNLSPLAKKFPTGNLLYSLQVVCYTETYWIYGSMVYSLPSWKKLSSC